MGSGTGGVVLPVTGPAALVGGGDSNFGGVTCPPGGGAWVAPLRLRGNSLPSLKCA